MQSPMVNGGLGAVCTQRGVGANELWHRSCSVRVGSPSAGAEWPSGPNLYSSRGLGLSLLLSNTQGTAMKLFEIEIGRRYKCDRCGNLYFATVKEKRDGQNGPGQQGRDR
jgi:hypothetical protein